MHSTVIGDGEVGKSCLLLTYLNGIFPQHRYVPTVYCYPFLDADPLLGPADLYKANSIQVCTLLQLQVLSNTVAILYWNCC